MKAKNFEEQFDVDFPTWMIDPGGWKAWCD
jgi:hypothetical protein